MDMGTIRIAATIAAAIMIAVQVVNSEEPPGDKTPLPQSDFSLSSREDVNRVIRLKEKILDHCLLAIEERGRGLLAEDAPEVEHALTLIKALRPRDGRFAKALCRNIHDRWGGADDVDPLGGFSVAETMIAVVGS